MPGFFIPTPVHTNALKYDGYVSFVATFKENLHYGYEV